MSRTRWIWLVCLVSLWLLRLPSLAQPMASDQGLYAYAGVRLLAGDVPYAGGWDQKPPGIHVVYAALWSLWPHETVVAAADLIVAGVIAWFLIVIGRRRFTADIGYAAAAAFLLFGNPALTQRLGGVFVRAQAETFVALAITGALTLVATRTRAARHLIGSGVLLGVAFWLKPNAATYALPIMVALALWRPDRRWDWRAFRTEITIVGATGVLMLLGPLAVMWAIGALPDLYLATVVYNAAYSGDTYNGVGGVIRYALSFPVTRAQNDALWFVGGLGVLTSLVLRLSAKDRAGHQLPLVTFAWLAAVWVSILINGARNLPQYFIQAGPPLALAAGAGLVPAFTLLRRRHLAVALAASAVIVWGAHRVSGFEQLADNLYRDWAALTGATPRADYLRYFGNRPQDKFVASAIAELADIARTTTQPDDAIYVFGYSPGVHVLADRRSASRFHWSQPIMLEFAADQPGYGTAGLLIDLQSSRPALVALQHDSWGPDGQHSSQFFHATAALDAWLTANYQRDTDLERFEVWRRR